MCGVDDVKINCYSECVCVCVCCCEERPVLLRVPSPDPGALFARLTVPA